MKHASIFMIICALNIFSVSCGKLQHKDNKPQNETIAPESQDATVDTSETSVPAAPNETTDKAGAALTGKDLYVKLCASCHAIFDKSDVAMMTRDELDKAIADVPTMSSLNTLNDAERDSLVKALSTVTPGKGKGKKPN